MVSVTLVVWNDALPPTGLGDVVVRVFSEDGLTFVTQGLTDADGEVVLELEDETTYWVRFFKLGYEFESRLAIDVDDAADSNTFDTTGVDLTVLSPSTSPYMCKAQGYVGGADLAARAGIRMTFMMTGRPRVLGGRVVVVQDVITVSDADGWIEVELARNGVYDLVVDGMDDEVIRVAVPDRASVSITELVWPYVAVLEYDVDAVELSVGEEVVVGYVVVLSSGVRTPLVLDASTMFLVNSYVSLTSEDTEVATIELGSETVRIVGRAVGTTTILAEVRENVEVERLPVPTRAFAALSITVVA